MIGAAVLEFIVHVLIEGLIIEGIGGALRRMGALIRLPFNPKKRYLQLLREGGNGWYGLLMMIVLISLAMSAC